jgi:hypothetical protein
VRVQAEGIESSAVATVVPTPVTTHPPTEIRTPSAAAAAVPSHAKTTIPSSIPDDSAGEARAEMDRGGHPQRGAGEPEGDEAQSAGDDEDDDIVPKETLPDASGGILRESSVSSCLSESGYSVSNVSVDLVRRQPESMRQVAALRELIQEGINAEEEENEAFLTWEEHVSTGRYDARLDIRIPIICRAKGVSLDLNDMTVAEKRRWLRDGDYKSYKADVSAGPCEGDVFANFDSILDRITASGGDVIMSLTMATFYFGPKKGHTSNDELRWACCGWTNHTYAALQDVARKDLIQLFNTLRDAVPGPPVREEFTLYPVSGDPIVMPFDEVDIGNRRLSHLVALCEHKNKGNLCVSPAAKAAHGTYPAAGARILRIRDPGGVCVSGSSPSTS